MQCDETRPACVNCTIAKKECSYTRNAAVSNTQEREFIIFSGPSSSVNASAGATFGSVSGTTDSSPRAPTPTPPRAEPYVNLLHLELFQNVSCNALALFAGEEYKDEWVATITKVKPAPDF